MSSPRCPDKWLLRAIANEALEAVNDWRDNAKASPALTREEKALTIEDEWLLKLQINENERACEAR
ncbi:hypothetical protein AX14_011109, partial [Amanita brunnescens Koide BX004]